MGSAALSKMPETEQDGTSIQQGEGNGTWVNVEAEPTVARMSITEDLTQASVSKEVQDESTTATKAAESLVESGPHEDVNVAKALAPNVEMPEEGASVAKKCKLMPATASETEDLQQLTNKEAVDHSRTDAQEEEETTEPASLSDVRKALTEIQTPGSICIGGKALSMPSAPGLHIQGIGPVPLPLTDHIVSLIQSVATEAPHGRGLETVLDTTVQSTLQIDPTLVSLQHPDWELEFMKVVEQVATDLGVDPFFVRADLYKLILNSKGGLFTPRDHETEMADGMFATLVIQLPSHFTGGTISVRHGDQSFAFSLGAGEDAAFACHYLAHIADCEHEVLPVTSGYRLALVYSLCHLGLTTPHATQSDSVSYLSSCLKRLPSKNFMFILPLSHQYTLTSFSQLGVGVLKSSDRTKQQALEIAAGHQWKMIVAVITRTDDERLKAVEAVTRGDIKLTCQLFYADGSSATKLFDWLRKISNFGLIDDGGMVLASKEEFDKKWGDGELGSDFSTRPYKYPSSCKTTYPTSILIVFNVSTLFEELCEQDLSTAIREAERNPIYVDRIFAHVKDSNLPLDAWNCFSLLSLTPFDSIPVEVAAERLELVIRCLRFDCVQTQNLGKFLVELVDKYGWSSPILAPIQPLLQQKCRFLRHRATRITPN